MNPQHSGLIHDFIEIGGKKIDQAEDLKASLMKPYTECHRANVLNKAPVPQIIGRPAPAGETSRCRHRPIQAVLWAAP